MPLDPCVRIGPVRIFWNDDNLEQPRQCERCSASRKPILRPQMAEHDVILTSFLSDLLEPLKKILARVRKIDVRRSQKVEVTIPAMAQEISRKKYGVRSISLTTGHGGDSKQLLRCGASGRLGRASWLGFLACRFYMQILGKIRQKFGKKT